MSERIEIGADVLGSDSEKLGAIRYVVVHPPELQVVDIVVSTGAILGRDVIVPVGNIERVVDGKVVLSVTKGELDGFKDYVEVHFKTPPEDWFPNSGFIYPSNATLWPAATVYPQITDVEVNAPPGTVGVSKGMDVESRDGERLGIVEALEVDPSTDLVTGITIRHGLFFKHDTRIPADAIARVNDDRVTLKLTREEVQRLEAKQNRSGS